MKKESLLMIVVSLIVGLLGGYLVFNLSTKKDEAPAGGGMPLGAGSPTDYQQRIAEGEKIVVRRAARSGRRSRTRRGSP